MSDLTRRAFLGAVGAASLGWALGRHASAPLGRRQDGASPNIILILFDTLSARHMSLYGYGRPTTPALEHLAGKAIVYHRHYAGGNYTTPGTATLLTGTLPWTHRAVNPDGQVLPSMSGRNLFNLLPDHYHRLAFSQNPVADVLLDQFQPAIDMRVRQPRFHAGDPTWLIPRLPGDPYLAYNTELRLGREERSLLLGTLDRLRLERLAGRVQQAHADAYPLGLPHNLLQVSFTVEATIDGIAAHAALAPTPFFAYFHLWPPHDPYRPSRPFVDRFAGDGFVAPEKPEHPLSTGAGGPELALARRRYDEYIAHVDAEFGRLYRRLESAGLLDNTILILTSDHGELFERGIQGHFNLVLYEGLVHIPLLIWLPGATERVDIHRPSSATDLLDSLLALAGVSRPNRDGRLPGLAAGPERPVFAVEAKLNAQRAPLTEYTTAVIHGDEKLVVYQYAGQSRHELYDLAADPDELVNLAQARPARVAALRALVDAELAQHGGAVL